MSDHIAKITRARMFNAAVFSILLIVLAYLVQASWPGSLVAVSLYKAHLMALGGWGGYWIDRALFPYARPDQICKHDGAYLGPSMLRRAIVVAACLVCVGLGA